MHYGTISVHWNHSFFHFVLFCFVLLCFVLSRLGFFLYVAPACPGDHSVDSEIHLSACALSVLGLKACATNAQQGTIVFEL